MSRLTLSSTYTLRGGVSIPMLGLGVYQSRPGSETREAVKAALELGYRHVDTAHAYGNERDVAKGIEESKVPRDEVFLTTKLWNDDHGYDATLKACDASLARLGTDHLDLYLVHWPVEGLRHETWRAMERILEEGKARAIGVSNYTIRHLDELLARCKVPPAVNQVEFHPFLYQRELLAYCVKHGIRLEAYAPLVKGKRMEHKVVQRVARNHARSAAQILLRWCIEHEVVVIPKSVHRERIEENSDVFAFTLDAEEMKLLDGLDEGFRTSWDPTDAA